MNYLFMAKSDKEKQQRGKPKMDEKQEEMIDIAEKPQEQPEKEPKSTERKGLTLDKLIGDLIALPDSLLASENKLLALQNKLDAAKNRLKSIEIDTYKEVSQEKNAEDKPVFGNEKLREAEVHTRMAENKVWQEIKQEQANFLMKFKEEQINLDYLKNKFRSLNYVVQALNVKYRMG